jgi:hypothetical protein
MGSMGLVAVGCILALAALAAPVLAQQRAALPAILADRAVRVAAPLPDFSYAGYRFGLEDPPTDPGHVLDAVAFGVVANDGLDDANALLSALEAAEALNGRVTIRLPAGRVQIGAIIPIERSDTVLAGAGSGQGGTELFFPRPLNIVDTTDRLDALRAYLVREEKYEVNPGQNINFLFSEYSWTAGFLWVAPPAGEAVSYDPGDGARPAALAQGVAGEQFSTTLRVADARGLAVGQVVQLQWYADQGPDSAILRSMYGDLSAWNARAPESQRLTIGSHHWSFPNRPVVAQSTRIMAIRGNRITLGDPLLHAVRSDQPASLAAWTHLHDVGIQDMRLTFPDSPWFGHHLEAGYNGIYFTGVFDGWIRNVVIHNADSAILTDNAASLTIADVVTSGARTAHYSVHVGSVHNVLVRDLRVENPVIHPLSVNTRATRSVYQRPVVLVDAAIDQHSGSNHQNLFDAPTLTIRPTRHDDGVWRYRLWRGGGAGYWKPGHGLMNTHWNYRIIVENGPPSDEPITLVSGLEGPGARIVGLSGAHPFSIAYTPDAYVEGENEAILAAPSLYDYQLQQRRSAGRR